MEEKKVYYKISRTDLGGGYIAPNLDAVEAELGSLTPAEVAEAAPFSLMVTPVLMTDEEYDAIEEEFQGW